MLRLGQSVVVGLVTGEVAGPAERSHRTGEGGGPVGDDRSHYPDVVTSQMFDAVLSEPSRDAASVNGVALWAGYSRRFDGQDARAYAEVVTGGAGLDARGRRLS